MRRYYLILSSMVLIASSTWSCSKNKGYSDVNEKLVVGQGWSDTDNQLVAEDIVAQVMQGGWMKEFKERNDAQAKPVIGIGRVKNLTSEELDTTALVNYIKNELINGRKVKFVANEADARGVIEKEMAYQHGGSVKKDQRAKIGEQTGLAYFLVGEVSSKSESDRNMKVVNYQVNFRLVELQSSEEVWSGQKRIRKRFEK